MPRAIDGFIFDLDGTLADTITDIALSLNHALSQLGRPPCSPEDVPKFIGDGAYQFLEKALGIRDKNTLEKAVSLFVPHYNIHATDNVALYPGVTETLNHFSSKKMAVVSNKDEIPTQRIVEKLDLAPFIKVIYGGDSLPVRKPDPRPLWEASKKLALTPQSMVIVGDSPSDIQAGKAAGMITCAVTYGFRSEEDLKNEKPDYLVSGFSELKSIFN